MNEQRKLAKQYLSDASLTTFWDIVRLAKISDDDQKVLDLKFVHGLGNVQIAMSLNMSLEKVNSIIKRAYNKVAKLI